MSRECLTCGIPLSFRIGAVEVDHCDGCARPPVSAGKQPDTRVVIDAKQASTSGGHHVSYYAVDVQHTTKGGPLYRAEAMDIIDALDMTFAEGEAFKAIWRCAADRLGAHKAGNDTARDAEKVVYYGEQMLARERRRAKP